MAQRPLDDFLPFVLPDVPGCAETGALDAIISATIEFCEKSMVLQADHDPVSVKANVADYDLEPPTGYLICKVLKAWYLKRVLTPTVPDDMDDPTIYNPALGASGGAPLNFIQKDPRSISLWPLPQADAVGGLTLRVALKPKRDAVELDEVLYEDWADVITAGAKAGLQIVPGKIFYNPAAANLNQGMFTAGINRALMRGYKGNTRANLSVRMRRL